MIAATLWVASQLFGYLLVRMRSGGNLAASGVAAVGMMTRAIVVMGVIFVVALSDPWVGLAAAVTYALAYTVELVLSLVVVLREPAAVRRALFTISLLALALPGQALARGEFDPTKEFEQHEWVPIHLGPLDLSITKAVVYLMLGSVLTMRSGSCSCAGG